MGRGSSGAGGVTSGVNPANIKNERDLVSERERKQQAVDSVLTAARYIDEEYGVDVSKYIIADFAGKDTSTLACTDGNMVVFNNTYFDEEKMAAAYDACVESGFHPSRGNKSGIEAVASHEDAHVLVAEAGKKLGMTGYTIPAASDKIVRRAMKATGYRSFKEFSGKISGYAKTNASECVAEAFADVYCNGSKASKESQAVVNELNNILK